MFCPNCGKEMSDTAAFCPSCGYSKSGSPAANNAGGTKNASIVGAIAGIVALVGCFMPFMDAGFGLKFSFMDVKKTLDTFLGGASSYASQFGYSVPIQYQLIGIIPIVFLVACVIGIICAFIGNRAISRIAGIISLVILVGILFFPVEGHYVAQVFSYGAQVGIGLILMAIGAIGMLISP